MFFVAIFLVASLLTISKSDHNLSMPCVNGLCPEHYTCNVTSNVCLQNHTLTPVSFCESTGESEYLT
uniref:Uncharacterized protein n=1 Tax=Onchocerca volvulus TaxID=6282 RepID=A0A8R1XYF6_ONCVO